MAANSMTLEKRVDLLEKELTLIKSRLPVNSKRIWWQEIAGIFENDPAFDEILALGQAIREQERTKVGS
jgi:hypothetical protein